RLLVVTERESGRVARPAGILPLRLGREPVAQPVPVGDLDRLAIALVERRQALLLAERVAERDRIEPGDTLDRETLLAREMAWVLSRDLHVFLLGDRVDAQIERPADGHLVPWLLIVALGRSHLELPGGDQLQLHADRVDDLLLGHWRFRETFGRSRGGV